MHSSLPCPYACCPSTTEPQQQQGPIPLAGASLLPLPRNQPCQLSPGRPFRPPSSHGLAAHLACPMHAAPACRDPATVCVANYPGCSTCGRCCKPPGGRSSRLGRLPTPMHPGWVVATSLRSGMLGLTARWMVCRNLPTRPLTTPHSTPCSQERAGRLAVHGVQAVRAA